MMAPSKGILIVVASLTGGGAERVAAVWADGLAESGHRVTVLTDLSRPATFMPSHRVRLVSLGLTARPAGRGLRFASWAVASRFRAAMTLWRILRNERIDVIVDVGHQYGAEVLAIGRLKGVKLLQTDHNACTRPSDMPLSLRDRWRKFVQARFYDAVTVLTEPDRREMSRRGVKNAVVLHNPLVFERYAGEGAREKVVVAVARPGALRVKGVDVLLEAWRGVWERHRDWRLRIVGVPRADVGEPDGVETVPFSGDIAAEYREAEIFVMPSRCEGWGLAAVEAMSQGCAAVICDFEGRQREYVADGVNGLVCRAGDAVGLENAIERLICDDGLRRRLQLAAPDGLERFAPALVARRLEKIIYRVCGDSES